MATHDSVAGSVAALTLLSRQVLDTKALIERSVEDVCQSFESTARRSQQNLERTMAFIGQHNASSSGSREADLEHLIESSENVLHHLLNRLVEVSEMSRGGIQRLNQIDEQIQRVSLTLSQMNEISTANRILAVNARIQAAHLGERGAGFGVVADEISAQAKRSTEFSDSISSLILQLREAVGLTRQDLVETASHDREAMEESKQEVLRTHADFRSMLDRTQRFLTEAAADSRELTKDIHESVRGLQFQDRTSQRLQFIASEVDRLSAQLATEFDIDRSASSSHPTIREMMTRTSMAEQREQAALAVAAPGGEVELF